jgi:hypothetical protein
MPNGISVSEDLRWAIVRMAPLVSVDTISAFTNVSRRQVLRIQALFRATGKVVRGRDRRMIVGRRRHLSPDDVAVCVTYLTWRLFTD